MSPRNSTSPSGGPYRKPRADVYTILLIIALIALMIGIWRLYDLMAVYEFKFRDASLAPTGRHAAVAMVADFDLPTKSTDAPTPLQIPQFGSGG